MTNKRITAIVVALVALAALEFGLIGADAAGLRGGAGPSVARGVLPPTATGTPTPASSPPSCHGLDPVACAAPASIELKAEPLGVVCDGVQTTSVLLRVRDSSGMPIADGIPVTFNLLDGRFVLLGHATETKPSGAAGALIGQTQFVQIGAIIPLEVAVGDLNVIFRIPCRPVCPPNLSPGEGSPPCANPSPCDSTGHSVSPPCPPLSPPVSPPPSSCDPGSPPTTVSPPCATPISPPACNPFAPPISPPCTTPVSPPTCDPASQPISPPCATPVSPPPCDPHAAPISPPCGTPVSPPPCDLNASPISPPCVPISDFALEIDCDVNTPGVQSVCEAPEGAQSIDADIVFSNNGDADRSLIAFNVAVRDSDTTRLKPAPGVDADKDGNPDFNQQLIPGSWRCDSPPPNPNTGEDGAGKAVSMLVCLIDPYGSPHPDIAPGGHAPLARVHYVIPTGAAKGSVVLSLGFAAFYDADIFEIGSCNPDILVPMACFGASVLINQVGGDRTRPVPTRTTIAPRTPRPRTPTPEPAVCADVTGDGRVTGRDVERIALAVWRGRYRAAYDLNHDRRLSLADVGIAIAQLGRRC